MCLESILDSLVRPDCIIVCDNGSPNDSMLQLRLWAERAVRDNKLHSWLELKADQAEAVSVGDGGPAAELLLVKNERNLGYAGGNNVGLRLFLHLATPFIWLLNNDTLVRPESAGALLEHMREQPRCGLCGALTRYLDSPEIVQCLGGGWHRPIWGRGGLYGEGLCLPPGQPPPPLPGPLDYVNGASVFIRREFLEQVGLMEEAYFLYCEELDWAERARGRWELGWEAGAEILHREGVSTGLSNRRGFGLSLRALMRLVRSRLLFTWKFHPWALPTVILGQTAAIVRKVLSRLASGLSH